MKIMKAIRDIGVESLWGAKDFIKKDEVVIFLGEIEDMPEHCIFVFRNNTYAGYHTDNFYIDHEDSLYIKEQGF